MDLVKADALVELALGAALLAGPFGARDFPSPVGRPGVVAVGVALVPLGALIWSRRVGVRTLALGNALTALAAVAWLAAAPGFSTAGAALVAATVGALTMLAVGQALGVARVADGARPDSADADEQRRPESEDAQARSEKPPSTTSV